MTGHVHVFREKEIHIRSIINFKMEFLIKLKYKNKLGNKHKAKVLDKKIINSYLFIQKQQNIR